MYHHTARMLPGLSLQDHRDARALWTAVTRAFPDLVALCIMPNHVHLLLGHDDRPRRLPRALSAWARWRNWRAGSSGGWWLPCTLPEDVNDEKKERRILRYVLLNPCRAGLVADPLAWPWSTHRDRVGFADPGVGPRERLAARFHEYVSGDPSVAVEGTELPKVVQAQRSWVSIRDTVCSITRSTSATLTKRGRTRALAVETGWIHGLKAPELAAATAMTERQVYRVVEDLPLFGAKIADPGLHACVNAVGDPRLEGILPFPSWGEARPSAS
jgi:hypothetical protein